MTVLGWCCVLAVITAAVLFGRTAVGGAGRHTPKHRTGVVLSICGPLLAGCGGLLVAAASGAWLPVAAGTVGAVIVTSAVGAVLAP